MNNLILAGMKHSGKSTLGRALALGYGISFFDLDDLLTLEDPENRGLSPRGIFRDLGKETFQDWESRAAEKMSRVPGPWILALGGGTISNPPAMEALRNQKLRIFLQEDSMVLYNRIMAGGLPAFLNPRNPWEDFTRIYDERTKLMNRWCPYSLNLQGASIPKAQELLITLLKEIDHGW